MLKRTGLLSAIAMSLAVGAIPAAAQSGSMVYVTFYYDAYGNLVGKLEGRCFNGNITYTLTGSQSPYSEQYESYICGSGGPEPY